MIKAVIFDMDGLLIDSEPLWAKAYKEVFKKLADVTITDQDMLDIRGGRPSESIEHFFQKYKIDRLTPQEMESKSYERLVALVKEEGRPMPGAHKALQVCKNASLPVAIASSSPMLVVDAVVETLKIREEFDYIYSAQFESHGKPHPAVFLKVAKHFKVRPADCLVFEDAPFGVLAAKAAKMRCVAVPEPELKGHRFIRTADVILGSLEEFNEKMLARLSG